MSELIEVRTEQAPAPFRGAPYSQAVKLGELVFVSGQIAIDPELNAFAGGTVTEQTARVFSNISAILDAAGSSLAQIARTTVYLANIDDFDVMNQEYAQHVGQPPPSRTTIEAGRLPAGALVEIDVIAHI